MNIRKVHANLGKLVIVLTTQVVFDSIQINNYHKNICRVIL